MLKFCKPQSHLGKIFILRRFYKKNRKLNVGSAFDYMQDTCTVLGSLNITPRNLLAKGLGVCLWGCFQRRLVYESEWSRWDKKQCDVGSDQGSVVACVLQYHKKKRERKMKTHVLSKGIKTQKIKSNCSLWW